MKIRVFADGSSLANEAAAQAAALIEQAIDSRGRARILVATGASQLRFLNALTNSKGLDWSKVEMFHLDEYIGIARTHRASFGNYLTERFVRKTKVGAYHLLDGEAEPEVVCREIGQKLSAAPIDVAFAGIGENSHLAFNDPPADLVTEDPYHIVSLDPACRRQQVSEGWFERLEDVPTKAISITIPQLLKSRAVISVVPDARKAEAVKRCVAGPIGPMAPASLLRTHTDVTLYLDHDSAAFLDPDVLQHGEVF